MSFSKRFILRTVLIPSASILGLASATMLAQEAAHRDLHPFAVDVAACAAGLKFDSICAVVSR